jgi:hypothetical protein
MKRRKDEAPLLDTDGTSSPRTLGTIGKTWKLERGDGIPIPLKAKLF